MIHKLFFSGHLAGRSALTQVGLENTLAMWKHIKQNISRNTSFPQSSKTQKPCIKLTLLVKYRTSNSKSIAVKCEFGDEGRKKGQDNGSLIGIQSPFKEYLMKLRDAS